MNTNTPNKKPLFAVKNISYRYRLGADWVQALDDVSLEIYQGEFVCFSGPSGSGKSTLLNLLGLIEPIQQGEVLFGGHDLKTLSEQNKNHLRRFKIGFIFQQFHLIPILTAEENVAFFLSKVKIPQEEKKKRVQEALEAVELWQHRKKKPFEMSGGQRQRVAIARALAKNPEVIIADEPTASLDQKTGREIITLLKKLSVEKKTTILIATHDPMVLSFAEKDYHLIDGKLQQEAALC